MEYLHLKAETKSLEDPTKTSFDVVLAGYSYGALMTMRLPPVKDILKRFDDAAMGSVEWRIRDEVRKFARLYVDSEMIDWNALHIAINVSMYYC